MLRKPTGKKSRREVLAAFPLHKCSSYGRTLIAENRTNKKPSLLPRTAMVFSCSPFNLKIAVHSGQFRLDKVVFAGH